MPRLAHLQVYDNSAEVSIGSPIPDPLLGLEMHDGRLIWPAPDDVHALQRTPDWAKPLMEAALEHLLGAEDDRVTGRASGAPEESPRPATSSCPW
jgi:hypothetical protein